MKYAVGIDVGGTNTRVALINEKYQRTSSVWIRSKKSYKNIKPDQ